MVRLRLFARDEPARQIDSRTLDEGELTIGRGVKADWQIADPDRDLSRLHFTLAVRGGMMTIRDTSANGVFIGNPRTRIERDRAVPIARGESIVFGTYLIVAEEEEAALPTAALPDADPFGDPAGAAAEERVAPPKRRDPFASALKPDPVKLDEEPGDGVDSWERRRSFAAGDWEPVAPHRRPDHTQLIGTAQGWAEPPAAPAREHGLGFDAPFTSPILREPDPGDGVDIQIPSDWDATDSGEAIASPVPRAAALAAAPAARELPSAIVPEPQRAGEPIVERDAPVPQPTLAAPLPAAPANGVGADEALFESFCAGARLSPHAFAGEDREVLMERLGAIYRQSILGIADLMGERTALKNDFRMVRTTIRAEGNNPFKWVPPQRIAIELLRTEDGSGYTTGERALNEALHDAKAHMLCVLAGMRAAIGATFDLLSPAEIEKRTAGRGFVMPGQRSAAAWTEYVEMFAELRREADDSAEGPINKAFRQAYEGQLAQLDGHGRGR